MNYGVSVRGAVFYAISLLSGVVLGKFSPAWLLLPVFFGSLAGIAVLAVAAHRVSTPAAWGPTKRFVLVLIAVVVGPAGTEIRTGPAPHAFVMALIFFFGFVVTLSVVASAA